MACSVPPKGFCPHLFVQQAVRSFLNVAPPCSLLPLQCQEVWRHFPPTPDWILLSTVGGRYFHHCDFSKLYPCKSLHLSPVYCVQNGRKWIHSLWYVNIATVRLTAGTVHGSPRSSSRKPPTLMQVQGSIAEADLQKWTYSTNIIKSDLPAK